MPTPSKRTTPRHLCHSAPQRHVPRWHTVIGFVQWRRPAQYLLGGCLATLPATTYNGLPRASAAQMIVSCPNCETRFNIDPSVLLPNGRNLRCSRCRHVWLEPPVRATSSFAEPDADLDDGM
ncbi:MAG: hypothetical protein FJX56_01095, partial [Alphaproteobacteria bacterium]|nr:hypothetical protein [Alphaproteobacteria bacterium]